MATLDERLLSSYPVLARLDRTDTNGIPIPNRELIETSPDLWRIIGEACFGTLWNRPALTIEQRSVATISVIAALCRDDNLKGHVASGLDLGLSPEQIVEIMIQLIFYTGAPIATTAMRVAHDLFEERGIQVQPTLAYDTAQDPDELYRRGLAQREAVLGDVTMGNSAGADDVDRDWERYMVEYLWGGSVDQTGAGYSKPDDLRPFGPEPGGHRECAAQSRSGRAANWVDRSPGKRAFLSPDLLHRSIHCEEGEGNCPSGF